MLTVKRDRRKGAVGISRLMLPDAGSSWLKDVLNRDDGLTFPGAPRFKAQNC